MSIAKLSKSTIKRKITTFILTISLVLGSISFAFAHPTTADTFADAITAGWTYDNSGLGAPYGKDMSSSWYQIFGKNTLSMLRDVRYQLTGTDYDNHTGNSIFTYVNNIYSTLTNTGSGSILYGINQTNTKLSDIYTSVGVGGSGNNVLSKLTALINAVGDISIPDLTSYVSSIDTGVATINTDGVKLTGNALNRLNQIAGYTSWISTIRDTTERIEGIDTTISAISADTYSKLSSFNDDFNNITWNEISNSYIGVQTELNGSYLNVDTDTNKLYVRYNNVPRQGVYKFELPIQIYSISSSVGDIKVKAYVVSSTNVSYEIPVVYTYEKSNVSPLTLIADINTVRNPVVFEISITPGNMRYKAGYQSKAYYISSENVDYYTVDDNVILKSINNLFEQAKYMFFDDESIQAKKNNASQTTAVITGFTGSGKASATANDYGTLSTGVSDVKGGMTTNVNASSAFGIFNNQSGYSFWSNETLQELNSSGTNTRNLSKSNDDDGYVYYNGRLEYLLNAMNGGDKK